MNNPLSAKPVRYGASSANSYAISYPYDYGVYIAPLRGREDVDALWLEAPNRKVAEWVSGNLPLIEETLRPHTDLPIRVCIG